MSTFSTGLGRATEWQHFGVLAHSHEGAALCFRAFCQQGFELLGGYEHPHVTLDCIPFGRVMPAWESGDYDSARSILFESLERLARAGATFFACPDNTAHLALERPGPNFPIPGLHIAEVVAERARRDGYRRVGILGTSFTMEGPVYRRALAAQDIVAQVPEPADRTIVDRIIFNELVHGSVTDASRRQYQRIIDKLGAEGCDAVALACTEIPLIVRPEESSLPTLDSTVLLAKAALEVAVGVRPVPDWRGGPNPPGPWSPREWHPPT